MDVEFHTSTSRRESGIYVRARSDPHPSIEQLVFSLEDAAFRLLAHENDAYMSGDFEEVMKFAKWRNEIRLAADALCGLPVNCSEAPGPRSDERGDALVEFAASAEWLVATEEGQLPRDVEMAQRASSYGRLSGRGQER